MQKAALESALEFERIKLDLTKPYHIIKPQLLP